MKFSIVTPSFNQGRFIRDCIVSVAAQEGVEWEHIVVDACSTDETLDVLRDSPRVQWTSEPDRGQTDAINKGFQRATGDWLMWLNADDYLLPGALAQVRGFIERHPAARIVYGDAVFVREDRSVIRRKREHRYDLGVLLYYGCYIPSTACFYHRSIVDAGHLPDPEFKVCMDFEYYLRLARAGYQPDYIGEPLACFRWHETNVSSVFSARRYQERLAVQRAHLALAGRSWLGGERTLRLLFRAYQLKRAALRLLDHGL